MRAPAELPPFFHNSSWVTLFGLWIHGGEVADICEFEVLQSPNRLYAGDLRDFAKSTFHTTLGEDV
jgi:hypothetical protein